jgi:hypothetical protein
MTTRVWIRHAISHSVTPRVLNKMDPQICFPSGFFPWGFLTEILYVLLISPMRDACSISIIPDLITLTKVVYTIPTKYCVLRSMLVLSRWKAVSIVRQCLMFIPSINWRIIKNQQYALICNTPLFYMLAATCFGSSLPSSGSVLDPSELLEIQIEWVVYHIMCGYVACVLDCRRQSDTSLKMATGVAGTHRSYTVCLTCLDALMCIY